MARQYENIKSFVEPHGYSIVTRKDDYVTVPQNERSVTFECPEKHHMTLVHAEFCSVCVSLRNKQESEEQFIQRIEEKTGHTVLEIDNQKRDLYYQCGTW